jgi:hypothetical protein
VGIAFEALKTNETFWREGDQSLDWVITDGEVY